MLELNVNRFYCIRVFRFDLDDEYLLTNAVRNGTTATKGMFFWLHPKDLVRISLASFLKVLYGSLNRSRPKVLLRYLSFSLALCLVPLVWHFSLIIWSFHEEGYLKDGDCRCPSIVFSMCVLYREWQQFDSYINILTTTITYGRTLFLFLHVPGVTRCWFLKDIQGKFMDVSASLTGRIQGVGHLKWAIDSVEDTGISSRRSGLLGKFRLS